MPDSNRYARQDYTDIHYTEVNPLVHSIAQLKYDGIWCGAEVGADRIVRYFSRHGELKKTEDLGSAPDVIPEGLYIGELMFGSEWSKQENRSGLFYAFDCVELQGTELKNQPYHTRYGQLHEFYSARRFPTNWKLVANYASVDAHTIWTRAVESGAFEGMVFRDPNSIWNDPIFRSKPTLTIDLRVCGFEEGETGTRLAGCLGALKATDDYGNVHTVGGGLSDKLRKEIWANPQAYLGKVFVCGYKKLFASGQLRHPNFMEWHADKK